ncbi:hypothetical protein F4810DRAFT_696646 [Camillea tinctor]|nr:hypothetical protein F4810DRAFT_696646 [Camillea tinctor]
MLPPTTMDRNRFTNHTVDLVDEYPLDDSEEEAMCLLRIPQNHVHDKHINLAPSNVKEAWEEAWGQGSGSADEYDLTPQFSSALHSRSHHASLEQEREQRQELQQQQPIATGNSVLSDGEQDLLDESVDWESIVAATSVLPNSPPTSSSHGISAPHLAMQATQQNRRNVKSPFVRPPFPEKVRDRCLVPGLSSQEILRTCFRTGVMINQTIACSKQQQSVVFELFARVLYSNREKLSRKQHFQFVDLFKDQQPFPSAVLADWKIGSQLDRQSSAFLSSTVGKASPKLCWCLCRPIKDPKAAIGWTYMVLTIKETSWDQIQWSKRIVCGEER